jgi:hypothetical protein
MDDDNALDDVHETSPLYPFEKETLKTNTLFESNKSIPLLMTDNSSTNPPFTTPSNDPDLFLTAAQGVIQRRATMEPLPINEDNRSQSSIICEKSKLMVNIHHHRSTQTSMDKNNEQMST